MDENGRWGMHRYLAFVQTSVPQLNVFNLKCPILLEIGKKFFFHSLFKKEEKVKYYCDFEIHYRKIPLYEKKKYHTPPLRKRGKKKEKEKKKKTQTTQKNGEP